MPEAALPRALNLLITKPRTPSPTEAYAAPVVAISIPIAIQILMLAPEVFCDPKRIKSGELAFASNGCSCGATPESYFVLIVAWPHGQYQDARAAGVWCHCGELTT